MPNGRSNNPTEPALQAARRELFVTLLEKEGIARQEPQKILPRQGNGPAPLSFAQERLWFLDQLQPGNAVYNIRRAQRLTGPLDIALLTQALNEVVRRHEILRTTFPTAEGCPVQRVAALVALSIPLIDLRELAPEPREAEACRIIQEECRAIFDLADGPLWRLKLARMGDADHILVFTVHQILFDGWSLGVFFDEIETLYLNFAEGRTVRLPELPIQYADFAAWQRNWLQGEVYRGQLPYWKEQLGGTLPVLELPADRPRSAMQSLHGARQPVSLSRSLTNALKELSRREGTTLFVSLMAAFNTLLYRYAGQQDLIVGFPIARRNRAELQNLIGFFVNTLALRTDLSGHPTFTAFLSRVRVACVEAYAHQDLPFEKLVDELHQERDLSRNPLFQAMFAFQNTLPPGLRLPGIGSESIELDIGTAKFDLTLSLGEQDGRLVGFFEYSTDLFERSTIERMAGHFQTLLEGIIADPDQPISVLPLLTETEREQILVEWNNTALDYPEGRCMHELFEAQARRTPHAVAIERGGERLTFRELNRRANQLARHLRKLGVGPEKLVGVCTDRSLEMVIGLLGVLKSGAAYVPLDPKYPRERLEFMLRDAQVSVLLMQAKLVENGGWRIENGDTQSSIRDPLSAILYPRLKIVQLDRDLPIIEQQSCENPKTQIDSNQLAYVIYTSGSTGEPKGVAIEHRNAVALLHWAKTAFTKKELAGVLASTSICFDLSVFELFAPLCWGGKVMLVDDALALHGSAVAPKVTLINTVPSAISELLAAGSLPGSVRTVNLAGEPLKQELVRQIYQTGTVERVYDLYGPSETTTYSTFTLRSSEGRATIGRPLANTKIYLLDAALQPVPIGVSGELYIGGAGVARGYLNRAELTAEKFVPDPFAQKPDGRMYRTGDFARYLADGNIEYLGRADHQVKIRGYRIELGEIEAVLTRHPAIRQSVVVARDLLSADSNVSPKSKTCPEGTRRVENPKFEKHLVAYLVSTKHALPPVSELRSFLRERLPEFMLPAIFVPIEALPLTANGKIDRKALPAPGFDRPQLTPEFVAPRTETEELMTQLWREVLKIDRIGAHDNFFDLGGHSLLATRIVARVRASFHVELPLRKLFELPTVAALTAHVECLRQSEDGVTTPPIAPVPRDGAIPLSFSQRRLWFLHQLDPNSPAYNIPAVFRIRGPLNVGALEHALNAIISRHESLRTAIVEIDGEPLQRVMPDGRLDMPVIDLTGLGPDRCQAEVERIASKDSAEPYNLHEAPLMRVKVLRLGDEQHVLILNFHHIVCDGSSLAIFYRELTTLYEKLLARQEDFPPPLSLQYADFAAWQQDWLRGPALESELAYWTTQLGTTLPALDLPTDFERPAVQTYRGAKSMRRLSKELTGALKDLSRCHGVTLFMTLLAVLKILLARISGQDDIVVGAAIAGRHRPELEGLIGFFINALALRSDLSGHPTFAQALERVRETCLDAYARQDLPFDRIVEELNPRRDSSRNPIFQVLFNMADIAERELKLAGCRTVKLGQTAPSAKFDIVIHAPEIDGRIELAMVYNADLFSEFRIAGTLEQFAYLLSQVVDEPSKPIDQYSLVTPAAQAVLPNPTEPLDDTWKGAIQTLVAEQARQRPDELAIVDAGGSWTYRELDWVSHQLANVLVENGIKPKDAVAIYAHRDASMAIALLGVLKAGAIFVIIDPAYPAARLIDYLRIAQPKGWLELAAADKPPEELGVFLNACELRCHMRLPRTKEALARLLARHSPVAPDVSVGADDAAYIAYTSGSTGQPKGVLCRHGPITHFLPWQNELFDLKNSDRYSLLSGLGYNHLHRDLFTALASGAALYIPTDEQLNAPEQLVAWLRLHEITILHLTPALGRLLQSAEQATLPSVRRIFFGGDRLTRRDVLAIQALAPNARLVSFYGATETQRAVGYFSIPNEARSDHQRARQIVPTGRGAKDVQLLLLTSNGELAGIGELGELYVRSPHLAAGYVGDDTFTEANFVTNPFTGDERDRLYRTAELGRYLADGNVEWVGRRNRQVSIRGFRVELAEVESALSQYVGVRNVAVLAREFASGDAVEPAEKDIRLVAYIECETDFSLGADDLRRFLKAKLPQYMIPTYFQLMDRLPLSPNGKVDYLSLPAPDVTRTPAETPFDPPASEVERTLGKILAQVLAVERVGRRDNFFELGGHSLMAAQAAARVRESLRVSLDLRAFFEAPTLAALARRVEAMIHPRDAGNEAVNDEREEIEI